MFLKKFRAVWSIFGFLLIVVFGGSAGAEINAPMIVGTIEDVLARAAQGPHRTWSVRISAPINAVENGDSLEIAVPGLALQFENIGVQIKFGDLRFRFDGKRDSKVLMTVDLPSVIQLAMPDGAEVGRVSLGRRHLRATWDVPMGTITNCSVAISDLVVEEGRQEVVKIGKIEIIGDLLRNVDGLWSGEMRYGLRNLRFSDLFRIAEAGGKKSIEGLKLPEYVSVFKRIDIDGRYGSWFFGGALLPDNFYQFAINEQTVMPFLEAMKEVVSLFSGASARVHAQDVALRDVFSVDHISFLNRDRNRSDGIGDSRGQVTLKGLDVVSQEIDPNIAQLIPHNAEIDVNLNQVPFEYLTELTISTLRKQLYFDGDGFRRNKENRGINQVLVAYLGDILKILADVRTTVEMRKSTIEAPAYEAVLTGSATAESEARAGFTGRLVAEIKNGGGFLKILRRLSGENRTDGLPKVLAILESAGKPVAVRRQNLWAN